MIEGGLAGKVVGTGVYTFWNDMLYVEASAYQNLSTQTLRVLGEPGISDLSIGGAAPYWRAAFEYDSGDQSLEVGTFDMFANVLPSAGYFNVHERWPIGLALGQRSHWRLLHPLSEAFGGVNNFDGAFHNASQNNTIFAYTWTAF